MGKTKTKIMDDSLPQEESKKPTRKLGRQDELVEKLKAELASKEPMKSESVTSPVILREKNLVDSSSSEESQGSKEKSRDSSPAKPDQSDKKGKTQKPGKSKPRSKKYQEVAKDLDRAKAYSLTEAVDMIKKLSYSKFNGTLEAHINTISLNLRGLVSLPFASGKKLRILAFGPFTSDIEDGVFFGDDSTIEEINKGKVNFDLVITTPDWMHKLTKIARILGPRGLMPNPKNGTITNDLKKTIEGFQAGKTEYKTEGKAPVIHLALGKLNQPTEELTANIKTLLQTLGKTRVKKVFLSPTMGPSVKVDLTSI